MGSMVSGVGNIFTGIVGGGQEQAAAQAEWNANKALAQYAARTARLTGSQEVSEIRARGTQVVEQQRLAYAMNNVDASYGTAAAVSADTAAQAELDAQQKKNNVAREAWGYKVAQEQAHRNYKARADSNQNRTTGSILTGAGQLISGGLSLGGG